MIYLEVRAGEKLLLKCKAHEWSLEIGLLKQDHMFAPEDYAKVTWTADTFEDALRLPTNLEGYASKDTDSVRTQFYTVKMECEKIPTTEGMIVQPRINERSFNELCKCIAFDEKHIVNERSI